MKILIYGLNFSPELTGIGKYTGEMAEWLVDHGQEVRVVTAPPYYPMWQVGEGYSSAQYRKEQCGSMKVYRCPIWIPRQVSGIKRLFHLASFAFSSLPVVLNQVNWRPDVVFTIAPALFTAPGALLAARLCGAAAWLHIQDFELEAALRLNILPVGKKIYPLIKSVEAAIYKKFDRVSTISQRMVERLVNKGVNRERIVLFPNWVDTREIYPLNGNSSIRKEMNITQDKRVVLYSGSMGNKQGLELLINVADRLREASNLLFILSGDGSACCDLRLLAEGLSNVCFLPLQPQERLNDLLNMADIHVLPQRSDAADLVMPSKLSGMLASGKPVIAMANPGTELNAVAAKVGLVVPPEDVDALADAILSLSQDQEQRNRLGFLGRVYAEEYWDREMVLSGLVDHLGHLKMGE